MDAAWRCAAMNGYRNWTVDDVCAEAGASKGAFYVYFDSKDDLLIALLSDDADWIDGLIDEAHAEDLPGAERIRWLIQRMLRRREEPGRVQIRADLWAEMLTQDHVRSAFVARLRRRRERVAAWLAGSTRRGRADPAQTRALAAVALALADGLTLHRAIDPSAFQWRNAMRAVDLLFSGLDRS
jgi:AcrR family transcriptional regulator